MRTYQTVVVIDSLLKTEEIDAIIEKITRIINNNGGKIQITNRWEKKRLAYEIKKRQYGYYVEIVFDAPSNLLKILERDYQLDENILRYLTVHLDKRALAQREKQKAKLVEEIPIIPEEEIVAIEVPEELELLEENNLSLVNEPSSDQ